MTITEPTQPQRLRMSGLHMFSLIAGVLFIAGAHRVVRASGPAVVDADAHAVGIALILIGAVGLGRHPHRAYRARPD